MVCDYPLSAAAAADCWDWLSQGDVLHRQQGQAGLSELCPHAVDAHQQLHRRSVPE